MINFDRCYVYYFNGMKSLSFTHSCDSKNGRGNEPAGDEADVLAEESRQCFSGRRGHEECIPLPGRENR